MHVASMNALQSKRFFSTGLLGTRTMNSYVWLLQRWRWAAVLAIVLYHVRFLLLAPYRDVAEKTAALTAFYFATSIGHEAFVMYMLLGGMLLGGRSLERWTAPGAGAWRDVFSKAIWFYAAFIPAILLGGAFDMIGYRHLDCTGVYAYFDQFTPDFSLSAFAANLLPIQRFLVPGLGSNAMLYLLAYECWAYAAFACCILGGRQPMLRAAGIAIALSGIWLAPEFLGYLLLWLLGAAVFRHRQRLSASLSTGPACACFLVVLMVSRSVGPSVSQLDEPAMLAARMLLDIQLGLGLSLLLLSLAKGERRAEHGGAAHAVGPARRQSPDTAGVVILLSHFPFMMLGTAALRHTVGLPIAGQARPVSLLVLAILVVAIYLYAWALSRLAAWLVQSSPYLRRIATVS